MCRLGMLAVVVTVLGCVQPNTNTHMWTHFDRARDAHEAVLVGQLLDAQMAGQWLASHPEQGLASEANSFAIVMQQHAGRLAESANIAEAAVHTSAIAETCGNCHASSGSGPVFSGGGLPQDRTNEVGREMDRHTWAVARMWEGLVGPSNDAWNAGARVLREAPLTTADLHQLDKRDDAVALERRVHELGQLSLSARGSDRTVIYANLIATCASCHAIVRGN